MHVSQKVKTWIFLSALGLIVVLSHRMIQASASDRSDSYYSIYVTPAITDAKILPDTAIKSDFQSRKVEISACRGEYEPATFTVKAHRNLTGVRVTASDLIGQQRRIPANAVDVRVVKCWYQAGYKINDVKKRVMTPELLLKDDKLVKVDQLGKNNYLKVRDHDGKDTYVLISGPTSSDILLILPQDASSLQPVDIEINTNKQFWITVKVPDDARPGDYDGKLIVTADGVPSSEIALRLQVLPFDLEKPALRYSLYYRGRLSRYPMASPEMRKHRDQLGLLNSNWKTPDQYLAELRNMKAHGVEYPTVYQSDEKLFKKEMALRDRVGLPKDVLYLLGAQTGNGSTPEQLAYLQKKMKQWKILAEHCGYKDMYVYGIDEAKGDLLVSQRQAWVTVRQSGGKIFAAINKGNFNLMGDYIDLAIVPGVLDPQEAYRYHNIGRTIFSYSNPQVGEETPDTYRRNYGILLWKAGYDGAMNYAYQHSANHIWNDFDHRTYRDHVFAYPTANGVIDTVQYEGFREGIDDVRYLSTLASHIERMQARKPLEAGMAKKWLEGISSTQNPEVIRRQAAEWIIELLK